MVKKRNLKNGPTKHEPKEYLDFYTEKSESGCWIYTGTIDAYGYGVISLGKKKLKAHRASYELSKGLIPQGLCVCHACDTRACVNPSHLFVGTPSENILDAFRKGRNVKGSRHPTAKLSEEEARLILSMKGKHLQRTIADKFGVSPTTVHLILKGKRWKHIN